ncbi:MAG: MotA/TolQ/ExbB proton channel family protein [Planctomycetota bacterium]
MNQNFHRRICRLPKRALAPARVWVILIFASWFGGTSVRAQFQIPAQPQYQTAPRQSIPRIAQSPNYPATQNTATQNTATSSIAPVNSSIPTAIEAESVPEESADALPGWLSTVWQKLMTGGPLMIPLALCWVIVMALSLERLLALRRARVIPKPFVRRFTECVEDGQLSYEEATSICEEFDCPVAEVFHAAVKRWGRPMLEVEQAVMDAGDRVADSLKRFLRVFHAISNVSPLLGLLGTVLGMIEAFETISGTDAVGRPETLASGISMALVTTAAGLSVAIPAYLAYMYFASKSDKYLGEIDRLCQRIVECISAETLENDKGRKRRAA